MVSVSARRQSRRRVSRFDFRGTKLGSAYVTSHGGSMKSLFLIVCSAVLSICPISLAQTSSSQQPIPAKSDAQVSFEALKALAGTWTGRVRTDPHNPDIEGPIQVTMRTASGGSVVMHEMAPKGMPEPTMIYLEGDHLTLVHYCEAGNRRRLETRKSPDQQNRSSTSLTFPGARRLHMCITSCSP
jgi:hypothetical protein